MNTNKQVLWVVLGSIFMAMVFGYLIWRTPRVVLKPTIPTSPHLTQNNPIGLPDVAGEIKIPDISNFMHDLPLNAPINLVPFGVIAPQLLQNSSQNPDELRKKYFNELYPPSYLEYLKSNQEFLISEGFILQQDKAEFKNEEEVFLFLKQFNEYLYRLANNANNFSNSREFLSAQNMFSLDQQIFDKNIEQLKKLHNNEAQLFNKGLLPTSPASSLVKTLRFVLDSFVGLAHAQVSLGRDDCFNAVSLNKLVGSNTITPCCACGLQRIGKHTVFIEDCRRFGGRCNVANFGCLNGPGYKKNAIWDSVSTICGFD